MTSQCLFCRIIAGEIPSTTIYSDDHVYAFRDINPAAPAHILVIPRKHLSSIDDAQNEDEALLGKLMLSARAIARSEGLSEHGFRLVINTGDDGGQTVHHLHVHILGGRSMTWPPG
tara:strand:+ start:15676 stop:16023 length:348 start_codon:yes stop_codon:yes gene_type:complete